MQTSRGSRIGSPGGQQSPSSGSTPYELCPPRNDIRRHCNNLIRVTKRPGQIQSETWKSYQIPDQTPVA